MTTADDMIPIPGPVRRRKTKALVLAIMAIVFVAPAGVAFIAKFIKFARTVGSDELGAAALVPMLNYLAVAAGFICLTVWAAHRGMFKDIEAPKYKLLENEGVLDQADQWAERR